ncbi:hypothetical protein SAMN05660293_01709 [Dyadobacter psychrophilus]|uniref:Uncharacterized protein n=1 Tax=Dyadobacter psychrophilus TaxID=651661 RepID=A0A1T5DL38_9BACT|nr:hypothetical protein SAMN05660293_01709 [Dyadobacter psychrophilus]
MYEGSGDVGSKIKYNYPERKNLGFKFQKKIQISSTVNFVTD